MTNAAPMKKAGDTGRDMLYFFALSCILFIPFPFHLLFFREKMLAFIFERPVAFVSEKVFGTVLLNPEISSDSAAMYVQVLLLFVLSLMFALLVSGSARWTGKREKAFAFFRMLFCFFIAVVMMKYGFDKIFKAQFYQPEPNILFTPLGKVSKDLLFWSSMGTSYPFNVLSGLMQLIPALLLLFRRTRTLGLMACTAVLIHICSINFCFDISVKIYSCLLLFLAVLSLAPNAMILFRFFTRQKPATLHEDLPLTGSKSASLNGVLRTGLIGVFFLEAMLPYLQSGHFNDDHVPRPFLHGAYAIEEVSDAENSGLENMKRIFIHRNGYLIFEDEQEEMQDLHLQIDTVKRKFLLTDYGGNTTVLDYFYDPRDSVLELNAVDKKIKLRAKALDWKGLPALKDEFHWIVDPLE